ncbi:MAG TPA: hypothetical protein VHE14_02505 [Solirubrobacteraceae bacterium]|nr:hypothetical protein [Solirubrobacteraceae bacterium]
MDPFTLIVVGGMAGLLLAVLLIGKFYPGSGADVIDWHPTRSVEAETDLELRDVEQMLEAQNERRRRRGQPEITEDHIRARLAADQREVDARRGDQLVDEDVRQMLEVKNTRRRKRGESDMSLAELRRQLGIDEPPPT